MAEPDPARRIRAAIGWLAAWAGILAHPERQAFRERSIAVLAWALLLSFAVHLAVLSTLGTVPRQYGAQMRLTLQARVAAAAPERAVFAEHPFPDAGPTPPVRRPEPQAASEPPPTEAGAPMVLPERYFRSSDLDTPAQPVGRAPLIYPQGAHHLKVAGTVRLRVFIGADGSVEQLQVVSVHPPGLHFEQAALEAMRLMRYSPAIKDGQAVRSQKVIEVTFTPEGNTPG